MAQSSSLIVKAAHRKFAKQLRNMRVLDLPITLKEVETIDKMAHLIENDCVMDAFKLFDGELDTATRELIPDEVCNYFDVYDIYINALCELSGLTTGDMLETNEQVEKGTEYFPAQKVPLGARLSELPESFGKDIQCPVERMERAVQIIEHYEVSVMSQNGRDVKITMRHAILHDKTVELQCSFNESLYVQKGTY